VNKNIYPLTNRLSVKEHQETEETQCPVCDGKDFRLLAQLDFSEKRQVLRCALCQLEFVHPFLPNNDEATSASTLEDFRQVMLTRHAFSAQHINERADHRLAYYERLLGQKPRRILDVGAGTGWMVNAYSQRGVDAVGLEIDREFVEHAKTRGANVIHGDICQIDIAALGEFDVVCSSQTFEHLLKPKHALKNMVKAMRLGGILRIDVPNADSWGARVRRLRHGTQNWGVIWLPYHQIGYYRRTFTLLFKRQGLEILEISERPTDHSIHGEIILPAARLSRLAVHATKLLGHGYLLAGVARKVGQRT
jgi:SAM-dependent methyltransferase